MPAIALSDRKQGLRYTRALRGVELRQAGRPASV